MPGEAGFVARRPGHSALAAGGATAHGDADDPAGQSVERPGGQEDAWQQKGRSGRAEFFRCCLIVMYSYV